MVALRRLLKTALPSQRFENLFTRGTAIDGLTLRGADEANGSPLSLVDPEERNPERHDDVMFLGHGMDLTACGGDRS